MSEAFDPIYVDEEALDKASVGFFLDLLEKDIAKGNVVPFTQELLDAAFDLVGDMDIDLDAAITDDPEAPIPVI